MMNQLLDDSVIENEEIKQDILEILKEASGISIEYMAKNALKGQNIATKTSLNAFYKEQTKDNDRGDVGHE